MPTKNSNRLTAQDEKELAALRAMRDDEIDLSDAPESSRWSLGVRGRFYKPLKQQLSLRLDADVVEWFKRSGAGAKGYQSRINTALRDYIEAQERQKRRRATKPA
jgi:uncharacterized protein (DUF4415 family)